MNKQLKSRCRLYVAGIEAGAEAARVSAVGIGQAAGCRRRVR